MSHIYVDAVNQLRKALGVNTVASVTDNAITKAQNRALKYAQRGTDPSTDGHLSGAVKTLYILVQVQILTHCTLSKTLHGKDSSQHHLMIAQLIGVT